MARTFEEILQEDLARPVHRSPQFWEASVLLGGSPEEVTPHVGAPESEVAGHMAKARGRIVSNPAHRPDRSIEDQVCRALRSGWNFR